MRRFLFKRTLTAIPTLWLIATLTFFFLRWIPGGPFDRERQLPPEIRANLDKRFGLDRPLVEQYGNYLKNLARGQTGPSFKYLGRDTRDIIADTLPVSMQLGGLALLLSVAMGIPLGVWAAARRGRWSDTTVLLATSLGVALPSFVVAAALVYLFAVELKWLPPALWEGAAYMIMPAFTLALYPTATIARLTRSALLETLAQDFIKTARAKGASERRVIWRHALRASLSSVVSYFGPLTAALITGSFIVEYMFAIPGMGQYFVTAVTNRDYPLVLGVTMVYAAFVVLTNFLVDCAYTLLDARVRLS